MKKKIVVFLIFWGVIISARAQQDSLYIRQNAVEIKNRKEANQNVFQVIKNYDAVMIGEMHGTKEPAEFIMGMVNTLVKNKRKVLVGLEIPKDQYDEIVSKKDLLDMKNTQHFSRKFEDGRGSVAMAELILWLKKQKDVKLFFYDIAKNNQVSDFDFAMYKNIDSVYRKYPDYFLITLSGNYHNMIQPVKNRILMGCYMRNDSNSLLKDRKFISLTHFYRKGTMLNNLNREFKIHQVDNSNSLFSKATEFDNYLFVFGEKKPLKEYDGIIFSKEVTASGSLKDLK